MKYKKFLVLPVLAFLISGCNITLYSPSKETNNNQQIETPVNENSINVINQWDYQGTIKHSTSSSTKLSSEEVYQSGVSSTVYIISTTLDGQYLGSGVVFSEDVSNDGYAYIFTNAHVVEKTINLEVVYSNKDSSLHYINKKSGK